MFSIQHKTAKKIAKYDRWIQEVAAEEALKAAKALAEELPSPAGATTEERSRCYD